MKRIFFFLFSIALSANIFSQSCPNIDFTFGNFTNWQGYTGWGYPFTITDTGIVAGKHTIISTPGTDPMTGNNLQLIAPGFTHSAKLGNTSTAGATSFLEYTYLVDSTNYIYQMHYAIVLEDGGHSADAQPRFEFMARDPADNIIPLTTYEVSAAPGLPGFQTYSGGGYMIIWKDWDVMAMDFSAYMGDSVTVVARVGGCAIWQGAHFGYGYIIGEVSGHESTLSFCEGITSVPANAPAGFASYLWSTGQTIPTISASNTLPSLQCQVTTFGGYTSVLNYELRNVSMLPQIDWNSECDGSITFSDSSLVLNDEVESWEWDFGDSNSGTGENTSHSYSNPGDYSVTLEIHSFGGCSETVTQTVSPAPIVVAGSDTSLCDGSALVLSGTGSALSYSWNHSVINGVPFIPTVSGYYVATGIDASGCETLDSVNVQILSLPLVDAGSDTSICSGNNIILTGIGNAINYSWNNGVLDAVSFVPTISDQYLVTGIGANGCGNTDSIVVGVFSLPIVSLGNDTTFCGETIVLDAQNPGSFYQWNSGDLTQSIEADSTGIYSVLVEDINGCEASDTIEVTIFNSPMVDLGTDTTNCESIVIDAGIPGLSYLWNNGFTTQTILADISGDYFVLITDVNGCTDSDTINATILGLPMVNFILSALMDTVCIYHPSLVLSGESPSGGVFSGTGVSSGNFNPFNAGLGTHTITYEYTDANGCSDNVDQTIEVIACLGVNAAAKSEMNVYPNPNTGTFYIQIGSDIESWIYITDVSGKVVYKTYLGKEGIYPVTLHYLNPGIYFLTRHISGSPRQFERIVITN